jgi:hypothetical protein
VIGAAPNYDLVHYAETGWSATMRSSNEKSEREAMQMERFRKGVVSGLTLIALGVALVLAPIAAWADEQVPGSAVGGATQTPIYQVGNALGDGNGQ